VRIEAGCAPSGARVQQAVPGRSPSVLMVRWDAPRVVHFASIRFGMLCEVVQFSMQHKCSTGRRAIRGTYVAAR
jgi:hypothetical protein